MDYGDGSGSHALALSANKTFALSHLYSDNGSFTVTIAVNDGAGGIGLDSFVVTVNNLSPTIYPGVDPVIFEGATLNRVAPFTDPGADTWTATVDYGDGSGVQPLALIGQEFTLSHSACRTGDIRSRSTSLMTTRGRAGASLIVTVANAFPFVSALSIDQPSVNEGGLVVVAGTFTDPVCSTRTRSLSVETDPSVLLRWSKRHRDSSALLPCINTSTMRLLARRRTSVNDHRKRDRRRQRELRPGSVMVHNLPPLSPV